MHELLNSSKHLEHRGEWKAKTGEIQRSIKMQINRTGKGQESTTLTQMPACVHNSGYIAVARPLTVRQPG